MKNYYLVLEVFELEDKTYFSSDHFLYKSDDENLQEKQIVSDEKDKLNYQFTKLTLFQFQSLLGTLKLRERITDFL